jgi:hypothetical protein
MELTNPMRRFVVKREPTSLTFLGVGRRYCLTLNEAGPGITLDIRTHVCKA